MPVPQVLNVYKQKTPLLGGALILDKYYNTINYHLFFLSLLDLY